MSKFDDISCGLLKKFLQLTPKNYQEIEILMGLESGETVTLGKLTPRWWI